VVLYTIIEHNNPLLCTKKWSCSTTDRLVSYFCEEKAIRINVMKKLGEKNVKKNKRISFLIEFATSL
jgi:hypothetical protein